MGERSSYVPGTPNWVDIGTDLDGALPFYTALFGWEAVGSEPVELTGGYGQFHRDGKRVAGYGPQQNPGPPFWSTYFCVEDASATAERVSASGGQVVVPAMDVMEEGAMAVFQDPAGAFFSVWQPKDHTGAELVNATGALAWNELMTRDMPAASRFYGEVFGLEAKASVDAGDAEYYEWRLEGRVVGGLMAMPADMPDEVLPYWNVYFGVDDLDVSTHKVTELGGGVMMPRMDSPAGPIAAVHDPRGGNFSIIQLTNPDD